MAIFAGDSPPNPSELLGSSRLSELVKYLAADHVVIIDAPPVLPVTDAVALAEHVDGMLMIVRAGRTTSDQLRQAMTTLTRGGGKVIGLVLNQVAVSALGKFHPLSRPYMPRWIPVNTTSRHPSSEKIGRAHV